MKILKQVLFSIMTIIFITILVFIIQLFLKTEQENMFLLLGFLMTVIIATAIISKKIKVKFLQGKLGLVLLVFILISISISTVILTMFNMALLEVVGEELTAKEKWGLYKESFGRAIDRDNYTKKINSYSESGNKEEFRYITFYFSDNIDEKYIDAAKKCLPKVESATENIFGKLEKKELKVVLHDNIREFQENTNIVYDIDGLYSNGAIHISMAKYGNQPLMWIFEDIFIHEYAHYYWMLYINENDIYKNIPLWFEEGVAEYIKNTEVLVEYPTFTKTKIEELKEMNTHKDIVRLMEDEDYDPYEQSYYAIDSLIEMNGTNIITDILNKSKSRDFYEAFSIATGMIIEEFQQVFIPTYIENYERKIEEEIEMMEN